VSDLRLRPLRDDDEAEFAAAHEAMKADGFVFGLFYEPGMRWSEYLAEAEAARRGGIGVPPDRVWSSFLVAEVAGTMVGRSSIRHELTTDFLVTEGGHIGYGVLPQHRKQGYATEILRQSLIIARSFGTDRALVVCDDDNTASATVIERCGGVFDSTLHSARGGQLVRRYWID
jgi:predicted acetyltransferase